jgi:hypothetical protein
MMDFPSSTIPAMPSQCLPRTFSSRLANTCSQAFDLSARFLQVGLERCAETERRRPSGELWKWLDQLLFGVGCVAEFVDECIVQSTGLGDLISPRNANRVGVTPA